MTKETAIQAVSDMHRFLQALNTAADDLNLLEKEFEDIDLDSICIKDEAVHFKIYGLDDYDSPVEKSIPCEVLYDENARKEYAAKISQEQKE